ncbi:MAG: hypothetical protein V3V99_08060 [candidate division Zixibacteria bacterium]
MRVLGVILVTFGILFILGAGGFEVIGGIIGAVVGLIAGVFGLVVGLIGGAIGLIVGLGATLIVLAIPILIIGLIITAAVHIFA